MLFRITGQSGVRFCKVWSVITRSINVTTADVCRQLNNHGADMPPAVGVACSSSSWFCPHLPCTQGEGALGNGNRLTVPEHHGQQVGVSVLRLLD
jgi:hypothetical protein